MLFLWAWRRTANCFFFISKVKSKPHVALNRKLHALLMGHGAEPQTGFHQQSEIKTSRGSKPQTTCFSYGAWRRTAKWALSATPLHYSVQRAFQINHPLLTPVNEVRFTWDTYPITPYLPYNPMPCFKYYSFVLLNSRCCQIFEMQSFYMTYVLFFHL